MSTNTLEHLRQLAADLIAAQEDLASLEEQAKHTRARIDRLAMGEIPDVMDDLEMVEFTLKDGSKITIKDDIVAKPLVANRAAAYEWMRGKGFGDLVKHAVTIDIPRGDEEQAAELVTYIEAQGFLAKDGEAVHSGTMKKFVREWMETGKDIPMDLFGIRLLKTAKVTAPKN